MALIAITGPIGCGKSTAIDILKARNGFEQKFEFFDFDEYAHNMWELVKEPLDNLCKHYFNDIYDSGVADCIFEDPEIYSKFCAVYAPHFERKCKELSSSDTHYIIEASALPSYPTLVKYFLRVIELRVEPNIQLRNCKKRGVSLKRMTNVTRIFEQNRKLLGNSQIIYLENGTYVELRAKVEQAYINLVDSMADDGYLARASNLLSDMGLIQYTHPYFSQDVTRSLITSIVFTNRFSRELGYAIMAINVGVDSMCSKLNTERSKFIEKIRAIYSEIELGDNYDFTRALMSVYDRTDVEIIENERLNFKAYQTLPWSTYRERRIRLLNAALQYRPEGDVNYEHRGVYVALSFVRSFEPRVAWFCGSFNPFTIGQKAILIKAQRMFDKVVLVQGRNPLKDAPESLEEVGKILNVEVIDNVVSIPQALLECDYMPVLIRGIRGPQDTEDTTVWLGQIKEFVDVECVMIPGDPNLAHISSSFVRHAQSIGTDCTKFLGTNVQFEVKLWP